MTAKTSKQKKPEQPEQQSQPESLNQSDANQPDDAAFLDETGPTLDELMADMPDDIAGREPEQPVVHQEASPEAGQAIGGALGLMLNIGFMRAGVPPLTEDEQGALGMAVADVAAQYDLGQMSPKTAAWLGLGMVTFGTIGPRVAIAMQQDAKPETPGQQEAGETGGDDIVQLTEAGLENGGL